MVFSYFKHLRKTWNYFPSCLLRRTCVDPSRHLSEFFKAPSILAFSPTHNPQLCCFVFVVVVLFVLVLFVCFVFLIQWVAIERFSIVFALLRSVIGCQNSRHFLNQWEANPKPIVPRSHVFSRAWHRLPVFASSSDWFILLFPSVMIGRSNYFAFDFATLNLKPL